MMGLMIAGTAVLNSLVKDLSPELATMVLTVVIGGYTLIGGLGATFYVSYFNTTLIFGLVLLLIGEVFYNPYGNPENPFGSSNAIYDFISCWKAPEGNAQESYVTFFSSGICRSQKHGLQNNDLVIDNFRWSCLWHCEHCRKLWNCLLRSGILAKLCGS